jgi:hypothetical protein
VPLPQLIHDRSRNAEAAAAVARDRAGLCGTGQEGLRETFLTLATALDELLEVTAWLEQAARINHDTIVYREQA